MVDTVRKRSYNDDYIYTLGKVKNIAGSRFDTASDWEFFPILS